MELSVRHWIRCSDWTLSMNTDMDTLRRRCAELERDFDGHLIVPHRFSLEY